MKTSPAGVTFIDDFIRGKQDYFKDQGVKGSFAAQVDPFVSTTAKNVPGTQEKKPTALFLAQELAHHEDVEILAMLVGADGKPSRLGHFITVTDLKWVDQDGKGTAQQSEDARFGFIDPNGGVYRDNRLIYEENGTLYQKGPTGDTFQITAIVSESPVPEPGTLALFGTGLAGLWRLRRRKTA